MPIRIYNDHSFTLSTFANMEDSRCQTPSQNNRLREVPNFPTLKDNYRGKPTKRSAAVPLVMPSCNLSIFSWITNSYHVILQDQRFARRLNYVFSWRALLAGVSQEWVHILFLRIPELCFSVNFQVPGEGSGRHSPLTCWWCKHELSLFNGSAFLLFMLNILSQRPRREGGQETHS